MTESTFDAIRAAIFARWPALESRADESGGWTPTVRSDFSRAVRRLSIDAEQADAALGALAMRCRSKRPFPRELLAALEAAQGQREAAGGAVAMSQAAEMWGRWLDRAENRAVYQGFAREWLSKHKPRALHLASAAGSLLQPRDPLLGRWSVEFLRWVASEAQARGLAIGPSGELVRTAERVA